MYRHDTKPKPSPAQPLPRKEQRSSRSHSLSRSHRHARRRYINTRTCDAARLSYRAFVHERNKQAYSPVGLLVQNDRRHDKPVTPRDKVFRARSLRSSSLRYIGCYRLSVLNPLSVSLVSNECAVACAYSCCKARLRNAATASSSGVGCADTLCHSVSLCCSCRHRDSHQPHTPTKPSPMTGENQSTSWADPSNTTSPTLSPAYTCG